MLALLGPLRRRWPKLDAACRAVEAYTSLFEQWGLWAYAKPLWAALVAAAAYGLSIVTESFIIVGAVSGLGAAALVYAIPAIARLRRITHVPLGLAETAIQPAEADRLDILLTSAALPRDAVTEEKILDRLTAIERALAVPERRGLLNTIRPPKGEQFDTRLDYIERRIALTQDNIDSAVQKLNERCDQLRERSASGEKQSAKYYKILATSLCARDALEMVREADAKIIQLGGALLAPYSDLAGDDASWADGFRAWELQIRVIDNKLSQWTENHRPFLPVTSSELERGSPPVPPSIISKSDTNTVRYKTVALVHPRYCNHRDGIINLFAMKARELIKANIS